MRLLALVSVAVLVLQDPAVRGAEPRIPSVPESTWTDAQRELVARFGNTNDIRTYLQHPVLAGNIMPFERYISNESTLQPRHRELLILRTAWLCRSEYIWARHADVARKAGMTTDELTRIARGPDAPGWTPFEATLLRVADEMHVSAFVNDSTWNALVARYNTREALDAVFTVTEFTMVAGTVNSIGVQVEDQFKDRLPSGISHTASATRNDERLIGKKPRIPALEPSEWTPEVRRHLDPKGTGRAVAGIYRTYAHHIAMDAPRTRVSEHIRGTSTLPARTRELLIMRIGWLCRSEYEWAAHAPAGRRQGMTEADVQRVISGPPPRGAGTRDGGPGPGAAGDEPEDVLLLRAVDDLHRDDVISERTWSDLAARYDTRQLLDVLTTIGGYRMVSMALNTLGVQLEPGAERFPASATTRPRTN